MFNKKSFSKNAFNCFFVLAILGTTSILYAEYEPFGVYTNDYSASGGGVAFNFYPSGYSDGFWWGYSLPRHPYGSHEMLSGEWAAAIYWDQSGSNEAIWLTDQFLYPYFSTDSIFEEYGNPSYLAWNDPNNPIDNYDTAYSVIQDNQNRVRITIDYELVDLGEQDANGAGGSPITFKEANDVEHFVYSERYICLQTYTIKNISASSITGLEFYQMLCGLADIADYSSYTTENYYDPLTDYTPYNSVHQVGNFRYDISQWGEDIFSTPEHDDWISFSSTIPPDAFENGMFYSSGGEPTTGTYTNIENRSLNNNSYSTYVSGSYSRIAGAMQWNLGSLAANETKKITIAVMFGCPPVDPPPPAPVLITKTDNIIDCVSPDDEITYTIDYNMADYSDPCVYIVDELPDEVDYYSSDPVGTYNPNEHTVTWSLGAKGPNDTGTVQVTVHVNQKAPPGGEII
ncbi:MAG: isopeptide-forming domain-containing fimbrial protein, partial [Sedimentisphaerales bacterium]|nr:isopeptide-forming domain-containing fimbrial protein [Sedimentisphaerales bacterium]